MYIYDRIEKKNNHSETGGVTTHNKSSPVLGDL